jgi:hypothetical protein
VPNVFVFKDPIGPAPARDVFTFDFTADIVRENAPSNDVINSVAWTVANAPSSDPTDPTPQARLIGSPTFTSYMSSALLGDMLDGVTYLITATANITPSGRILVKNGEVSCVGQPHFVQEAREPGFLPFDYDMFVTQFPEFESVSSEVLSGLWDRASVIFRNDSSSPAQDLPLRGTLLNMLTAHLASMFAGPGGAGGLVGRINSKSVNGVSVSSEGFGVQGTQGWYLTTRYGAEFWRATAAYRTFRYIPGPTRFPTIYGSRYPYFR